MKRRYVALFVLLLLLVTGVAAQAQISAGYWLQWNVIVGGGSQSGSANYVLDGTVGESLVGPPAAGSGDYRLTLGYTTGGPPAPPPSHIYLPVVVRSGS
jgi:hypothetical protein